jgi:hypothetical protein
MRPENFVIENKKSNKSTYRLLLFCCLLIVLIFLVDILIPLGVAIAVLYIAVVWVSFWSPQRSFVIIIAIVCSMLTVGCIFIQPAVPEMWKVIFNRCLALLTIWTTAFLGLQRRTSEDNQKRALDEREIALNKLRILRGLLPICSSCKKIRNDHGDWNHLEVYIREHSEANFSHGICPDCLRKLYPEYSKS